VRVLALMGVVSAMLLTVGCGGHGCHSFNETVCHKADQCGFTGCSAQFDSCPGNEKVDFSACIDATNASTCVNLEHTVDSCHVERG
jgi:hypothetical protein